MTPLVTPKIQDLNGFDSDRLQQAILGLTQYLRNKRSADLINTEGETIILNFELAKIPPGILPKPLEIDVPHPMYYDPETNICLIVRDPQKKWKELLKSQWKRDENNGMDMPKIIGLTKLKKNYATPSLKRELLRSFDLFLADSRIIELMPRILGRPFADAGKLPIEVKVKESAFIPTFVPRLKQTFMRIKTGPSVSVRIGKAEDPPKHLYQNAMSVLRAVSHYFNPSQEEVTQSTRALFRDNEIRSVHLTATDAPSLPIYIATSVSEAVEMVLKTKKTKDSGNNVKDENKLQRESETKMKSSTKRKEVANGSHKEPITPHKNRDSTSRKKRVPIMAPDLTCVKKAKISK